MIIKTNQISCDKCYCSVIYPAVKSIGRLILEAKKDRWTMIDKQHYCDKCRG